MKGWHKESYRHYLAAKGVHTKKYCAVKRIHPLDSDGWTSEEERMYEGVKDKKAIALAKMRYGDATTKEYYDPYEYSVLGTHDPITPSNPETDIDDLNKLLARMKKRKDEFGGQDE
jgi:hypothetical protein